MDIKVLFIIKKRHGYGGGNPKTSYGLKNSCQFVSNALELYGFDTKVVEVIDGNSIDKEVFDYKPTHVFLEAIWVTPDKLDELLSISRYKKIKWFIRVHSKVEFLAHEGMAFTWLLEYSKIAKKHKNLKLAFNNLQPIEDFKNSLGVNSVYAPNIYLFEKTKHKMNYGKNLKIGVFGAIREMKNHLNQAFGALDFASKNKYNIEFHINVSTPFEACGENILKNLRALFKDSKHKLVENPWLNHTEFSKLVKTMDICSQVSYSETCNITLIDSVSQNIPSIGSKEIPYLHSWYVTDPADSHKIAQALQFAHSAGFLNLHRLNERGLCKHNDKAIQTWLELLE
jgi:hypothetical protein